MSFSLILLGLAGPVAGQQAPAAPAAPAVQPAGPPVQATPYTLVPGDRLQVNVLEDPNLNSQVLVRPDGRITLPIAGSLLVAGLTPEDVQRMIRDRLAGSFNVTPTVNVALISTALPAAAAATVPPVNFYVMGEVNAPGAFQTVPPQTTNVLQALARAGGLGKFARGDGIQIRRFDPATGQETIFPFNYDDVEEGRALASNITLQEGDVIFVPERGLFD
jgi:polysaccharide export outer membrane protein